MTYMFISLNSVLFTVNTPHTVQYTIIMYIFIFSNSERAPVDVVHFFKTTE